MKFKRQKPTKAKYRHDQQPPVTPEDIAEEIRQRIAPLVSTLQGTQEQAETDAGSEAPAAVDAKSAPVEPAVDAQEPKKAS